MHGGHHVRAVGALRATGLHQPARLEPLQHAVEEEVLGAAGHAAGAELGEHAEVEPRVGQLEPERVLPVDPGAHRVGGLAVAEVLEELEDRHQREPPGRQRRLPAHGEERGEVGVLVRL